MPDLPALLRKWWKPMLFLTMLSLAVSFLVTLITPKKYLAVATAVPASSFASDRSRIFNQNIEALYSSLGTPDDLDLVVGTAALDTVYLSVVDSLELESRYRVKEEGPARRIRVATLIKKNSRVSKSGYGELKVKVWDQDPVMSAAIANAVMEKLKSIHQHLQSASNRTTLATLQNARERLRQGIDSAGRETIEEYEKLISQYQLLNSTNPPVLIAVENARVPAWHDKPRLGRNLLIAGTLALLFSLLLALLLHKRENRDGE